jgi:copper transport protein
MRLIAGLATLLWVLCLVSNANAHASLLSTDPVDGVVLAQAPKTVQLHFNEDVTPAVVRLIDAAGRERDDASVHTVGPTVVVVLPDNLPRGTQVVSYRVISQDGHPVAGSLLFSIGVATKAATEATHAGDVEVLIWLSRLGVYLGLFVGVGGVFFAAWIGQGSGGLSVIFAALVVGLMAAVGSLGLQGIDLLNLPLSDIATPAPWRSALATSLGPALLIAIAAMAVALIAWSHASMTTGRVLALAAMAGVGLSLAASGHAATAPPQWLMRPSLFLHGIAVTYWVGAFGPLVALARRPTEALLPVLYRFSAIAMPTVALLILTGLALAIIQLASFGALIETPYGLILSAKLMLVLALLGLAALNRFRFTPMLASNPQNTRPLVRSIVAECAIAVGILAVVAGWRFTPPPRSLPSTIVTPLAIHIHTEHAMFQVLVSPGTIGSDSFVLQLMNGDASPLPAKEATLTLSLPERGIEPVERAAKLGADGYWHVRDVPMPFAGRWHVRIDALVTDFEKITLEDEMDVPAR